MVKQHEMDATNPSGFSDALVTIDRKRDRMESASKNTLFVKNLSHGVTERDILEVFGQFDAIDRITFHHFLGKDQEKSVSEPPFARIDFESSKGVVEGSKVGGLKIRGVPVVVCAVDPNDFADYDHVNMKTKLLLPMTRVEVVHSLSQPQVASKSDINMKIAKTIRIKNVMKDMTEAQMSEILDSCFGPAKEVKFREDGEGKRFALAEFEMAKSAMLALKQKKMEVCGTEMEIESSDMLADELKTMEEGLQFNQTSAYLNGFGGIPQAAMSQAMHMDMKLRKVKNLIAGDLTIGGVAVSDLPVAPPPDVSGWGDGDPSDNKRSRSQSASSNESEATKKRKKEEKKKAKKEKKERKEKLAEINRKIAKVLDKKIAEKQAQAAVSQDKATPNEGPAGDTPGTVEVIDV